jgi:hypothetical protein
MYEVKENVGEEMNAKVSRIRASLDYQKALGSL